MSAVYGTGTSTQFRIDGLGTIIFWMEFWPLLNIIRIGFSWTIIVTIIENRRTGNRKRTSHILTPTITWLHVAKYSSSAHVFAHLFFFMQPEVQSYKFLLYCVLYKINFLCNDNMLRNWLYGLASVKCYNVTYASLFSGILNNALSRSKKCDSLIYLNQSWIS